MTNMEGLLHLSAFAAPVAVAYVGLDRLHWDDEKFETNLKEAEKQTAKSLIRYDLRKGTIYEKQSFAPLRFFTRLRLFTLCHVADVKIQMGWWQRTVHWIHLQYQIPLFRHFYNRWDRWIIKYLAIISLAIFLYVAALATWGMVWFPWPRWCIYNPFLSYYVCFAPIIETASMVPYLFFISAGILVWVCVTGALSQRLQGIKNRCTKLDTSVTTSVDKLNHSVLRFLPKEVSSPLSAAQPPIEQSPAANGPPADAKQNV